MLHVVLDRCHPRFPGSEFYFQQCGVMKLTDSAEHWCSITGPARDQYLEVAWKQLTRPSNYHEVSS